MLQSTIAKLLAVFVAGVPAVVAGGALYSWTSGRSAVDGFVSIYGALYKIPGEWGLGFRI
jgi:hypothetical protein